MFYILYSSTFLFPRRGAKFPAQEKKSDAQGIGISCAQKIFSCAGNRRTLRREINFLRRVFAPVSLSLQTSRPQAFS
jgi:hypothetical protein